MIVCDTMAEKPNSWHHAGVLALALRSRSDLGEGAKPREKSRPPRAPAREKGGGRSVQARISGFGSDLVNRSGMSGVDLRPPAALAHSSVPLSLSSGQRDCKIMRRCLMDTRTSRILWGFPWTLRGLSSWR